MFFKVRSFYFLFFWLNIENIQFFLFLRQGGTMVTYGGMSKKPITVSTTHFIFKVSFQMINHEI